MLCTSPLSLVYPWPQFGKAQAVAATAWVERALSLDPDASRDTDGLFLQQLTLFEGCLLDDADGGAKCKELDAALTELEMAMESGATEEKSARFNLFGSRADRAAARVRNAASKFGLEQKKGADAWVKRVLAGEVTSEGLLEQQVALFGECMLSEDGSPSKCEELQEALAALQEALEGDA